VALSGCGGAILAGMPNSARPDRQLVRSRSHQVWCLIVAAALAVFAAGFLAVGAGKADPVPQIVAAVIVLGLAGAAVRWSLACAVFDYPAGLLVVRNPRRRTPCRCRRCTDSRR
jgi:hypothetical protein